MDQRRPVVALHDGRLMEHREFAADIATRAASIIRQPHHHYALYYDAAYPFAVMLFALFHAGKQVWIPGNNRSGTAEKLLRQGCQLLGQWNGRERLPERASDPSPPMDELNPQKTQLTIFTSGSSGQPKAIVKTLAQLQREVDALERQWGTMVGRAAAVSTVSHQHIYGLLFRLLWPLASGRCFHSPAYLSPEPMLKALASGPAYWVASPAQLKRLDDLTDWNEIARLKVIFSSGGPLADDVARQIDEQSGQQVVEIYGSSETGGIGWRRTVAGALWRPFVDICLANNEETGRCILTSPFLPGSTPVALDDRIELCADGRFTLAGRLDRIVKVEEKRLSLDELEQTLTEAEWIACAHTLLLAGRRDRIAAVIVLSEIGRSALIRQGRSRFIKQLRRRLMPVFEAVVLPRKWVFMDALPLTSHGKIDNTMLEQFLTLDAARFPQLLYCRLEHNRVRLQCRIRPELIFFDGHFPGQPIMPGAAQLAWVERYGRIVFGIDLPFLMMEVIKFKKIIQPGALINMTLEWKASNGKLYFDLSSATDSHSSGRMVYGARA